MNITNNVKPRATIEPVSTSNIRQSAFIVVILALLCTLVAFISGRHTAENDLREMHAQQLDKLKEGYEVSLGEAYLKGKDDGIAFAKAEQEKLSDKPFTPITALSKRQETLCLAMAVYSEARGELPLHREIVAWSVVNRAIDERESYIFKNSVCAVVVAKSQYEAMRPYKSSVNKIVWGDNLDYIPHSASDPATDDGKAWVAIFKLSHEIMNGKRSRKTLANHFYSPNAAGNNTYPDFLKYMKLLSPAGKHLMAVDYIVKDGKTIYFTKENPYNPKLHG